MSFRDCINEAEGKNELTADQAKEARELFDGLEAEYQGRMNTAAAQAQAGADAFDAIRKQAMQRKRQKAMQLRTWQGTWQTTEASTVILMKPGQP